METSRNRKKTPRPIKATDAIKPEMIVVNAPIDRDSSDSRQTTLSDSQRSTMEQEVIRIIDSARYRLISNTIVNGGIYLLRLKDSFGAAVVVAVLLSMLIYALSVIINQVFESGTALIAFDLFAASLLAGFSLSTVKLLHDDILPPNAKKLVSFALDVDGLSGFQNWFLSWLSLRKQLFTSISFGLLSLPTLAIIERNTSVNFSVGGYFSIFIAMVSVSHGAYCAVTIPTLARVGNEQRMRMFWLNPAESSWIRVASWAFTKLAMADAGVVTICIVGMYWLRPWESILAAFISGVWLLVGLSMVLYAFLYPHHFLSKTIREEKIRQQENIQNIIDTYHVRLKDLTEDDFKRLAEYSKIYENIALTRGTAIDMRAWRGLFTSLVIPTLSFVGGIVDFRALLGLP